MNAVTFSQRKRGEKKGEKIATIWIVCNHGAATPIRFLSFIALEGFSSEAGEAVSYSVITPTELIANADTR